MSSVMSGKHPDDDLLADLAAEVLPEVEARAVEAHVIGCSRCADLLGEAERMRRLLVMGDPGPMPPEVLARIEAALQGEAEARSAGYTGPMAPVHAGAAGPWDDQGTWTDLPVTAAAEAGAHGHDEERAGTDADASTVRPLRPARRPTAARGQSRRDLRSDREPSFLRRHTGLLSAAAGVVLLVGLGGTVVKTMSGNDGAATSASASALESGAAAAGRAQLEDVPVTNSGTKYRAGTLVSQVRRLVKTGVARRSSSATDPGAGGPGAAPAPATSEATPPVPRPTASGNEPASGGAEGSGKVRSDAVEVAAGPGLRDPERLAQCLAAVGQPGARPVALDFATYNGREAAIIVLPGRGGGYEVWAVDPSCGPDGAGILAFKSVPA